MLRFLDGGGAVELVDAIADVEEDGRMREDHKTGYLEVGTEGGVVVVDDDPPADGARWKQKQDGGDEAGIVGAQEDGDGDVGERVDEGEVDRNEAEAGIDEAGEVERGEIDEPDADKVDEDDGGGGDGPCRWGAEERRPEA
jgi:hypothetical protein